MYKVSIGEAREGMVLVEPVMAEDGQNYLLKAGRVLNSAMLQRLKEFDITVISVADIHSLQINPIEQMNAVVKKSYADALNKYSSHQRVGNKRDDIPLIVAFCRIIGRCLRLHKGSNVPDYGGRTFT